MGNLILKIIINPERCYEISGNDKLINQLVQDIKYFINDTHDSVFSFSVDELHMNSIFKEERKSIKRLMIPRFLLEKSLTEIG